MEDLNPYAHHLGDESPEHVIAATSARLHDLLDDLTPEEINTPPGPTKWSLRELMAHLADCELVFAWRLRQVLSVEAPELHAFAHVEDLGRDELNARYFHARTDRLTIRGSAGRLLHASL